MQRDLAGKLLERLTDKRVLVVGDLMLDEYVWGSTERISPEAPVPVVQWERRTFAPGGAANVVRNVVSLGARAVAGGVVGDDNSATELQRVLAETGADLTAVVTAPGRLTTRKTRVFARSQQLLRVDRETTDPLPDELAAALTDRCLAALDGVDAVLFSDYAKGTLGAWAPQVLAAARERGVLVTAGPKPANLGLFSRASLVSFNRFEAEEVTGRRLREVESLRATGRRLAADLQVDRLVITRGGEGALLFDAGGRVVHVPAKPVHVFDECGAGDTFLTAATLALAAGADFEQAMRFASCAAAAVIQKVGVCPATPVDLLELCPVS